MHRSRAWRFVSLIVGTAAAPSHAQMPADLPARIDKVFARFDQTSPGCAVGLAKDGKPLYARGYGLANLEYRVPLTDSTVLESGSVAKQFTASALVLLAQDGKLSLDDDIRKYLPEVPDFGRVITIRNLLTHTSGLRDQWGLLGIEGLGPGTQVHSPLTTLDLIAHQKMLNFPPGSAYLYSNSGYALAGLIVQRVSGKTLNAFTQERLFHPLGMTHTRWRDDFTEVVPNRATAYSGSAATGYHTDMPFTNMVGNGGLLSTMRDLLVWNQNLDTPTIGGRPYVSTMETPMRLTNGRTITYALGLQVAEYDGVREVSHSGSTAGYQTFLARYPDQHVSIAVWCNYTGANPVVLSHEVADLVLIKPPRPVAQAGAPAVHLPAEALAKWQGTYRDRFSDQAITLSANAEGLSAPGRAGRGGVGTLVPLGDGRFRAPMGEITFGGTAPKRGFTLVRADGDTAMFEEVRPAASSTALGLYTGTYASDELDVRFVVAEKDGKLVLRRRPADEFELRPVYADDFQAGGGLGTLRFARDAAGIVTGFSFYAGRVVDVRFKRVSR
jgi:CubicO group peptidase (beta-lactamase class C family)